MKKNQLIGLIVAVVVIIGAFVAIVAATSGNKDTKSTDSMAMDSSSATSANAVTIKSYMFTPMSIKVKVGTKVTWTNDDAVAHTITADMKMDGAPDSMDVNEHGTYSFTFTKAGTYTYHCDPHPYMKGTVTVTE